MGETLVDLFGNLISEDDDKPARSFAERYKAYINSPQWKRKRRQAIDHASNQCQVCGVYGTRQTQLEVHHKTYERFMNERLEDLEVVCQPCHLERDKVRAKESKRRAAYALEDARLDGWASKVYGENWADYKNSEDVYEEFYNWLERRG